MIRKLVLILQLVSAGLLSQSTSPAVFLSVGSAQTIAESELPPTVDPLHLDLSQADTSHPDWQYRPDFDVGRPVPRYIQLASAPIDPAWKMPIWNGEQQRWAKIQYGTDDSDSVMLVFDVYNNAENKFDYEFDFKFDLYVDLNRDRTISADERIEGAGIERQFLLEAEYRDNDRTKHLMRTVRIQKIAPDRISIATLGAVIGWVELPVDDVAEGQNQATASVKRLAAQVDGDANGLFGDARDRLLIDLNDDGKFNPLLEQFVSRPIHSFHGRRFAVRGDRVGSYLRLEEVQGSGWLRMVVADLPADARVHNFQAKLNSSDGSTWLITDYSKQIEIPPGDYALQSLSLSIETSEGRPWNYIFSSPSTISDKVRVTVTDGSQVDMEAIGEVKFFLSHSNSNVTPGGSMSMVPNLTTGSGLLMNWGSRGEGETRLVSENSLICQLQFESNDGSLAQIEATGFH